MSSNQNLAAVLDVFEKESASSFYVPSLKRNVQFKPLTIGQEKRLIKSSIDNPVFQTRFVVTMYEIFAENCLEDIKSLSLNVVDFNSITLQYRKSMLGDTIEVKDNQTTYKGDINEAINKLNAIEMPSEVTVQEGNIIVKIQPPSFHDQYRLEKEIRAGKLTDEQIVASTTNISDNIGEAFIGELSKFIKEVIVVKEGSQLPIGYNNLPFAERFKLLERMPASLVRKMLPTISELTSKISEGLKVNGKAEGHPDQVVTITVDAGLFPIE